MTKRKANCSPEEWAAIRTRAQKYDKKERSKLSRRAYMRSYLKRYVRTPEYRKKDNARYLARKEVVIARFRKRAYGITREQTITLLGIQTGRCAICRRKFDPKQRWTALNVDHDHQAKRVRGLLCSACNLAEGYLLQTGLTPRQFGLRLARYLKNPPMRVVELVV